jgi:hypothetical protein
MTIEELERRVVELEKLVARLTLLANLSNMKAVDIKKLPI